MEFGWAPEQAAFREEVRDFLTAHWTDDDFESSSDDVARWTRIRAFRKTLARHGWLTMARPSEYGGHDAPYIEQMIFKEERAILNAPTGPGGAEEVLAPALILYGSEEQKRAHLPGIAAADVSWAQGYSEPSAGSDLASLSTRAVRDGNEYVVNGQKIWSSGADHSEWMHVLVRTDPAAPKHRGISYLLIGLDTPGITVRPIHQMYGRGSFNEVFFVDVKVPVTNRLGEENRGWYIAMAALDFERSGVHLVIGAQRAFEDLVAIAQGDGAMKPVRRRGLRILSDARIGLEVARLLSCRITWMQSTGRVPNVESSMAKVFGTELAQRFANAALNALASAGSCSKGMPAWPPMGDSRSAT